MRIDAPTRVAKTDGMEPGFADRIALRATALGITEAELARRIGVTQTHIWRWKTAGGINSKWLVPLAAALGTTVDYLLTGNESGNPAIDGEMLEYIIQRVRDLEELSDTRIAPQRFARLVALLYDETLRDGKPADADVGKLLRLVS